jgi:hypothetical protein
VKRRPHDRPEDRADAEHRHGVPVALRRVDLQERRLRQRDQPGHPLQRAPSSAGREWRKLTATSIEPPNSSTVRKGLLREIRAFFCRAPSCLAESGPMRRRSICSTRLPGKTAMTGWARNELLEKGRLLDRLGRYAEAFAALPCCLPRSASAGANRSPVRLQQRHHDEVYSVAVGQFVGSAQ